MLTLYYTDPSIMAFNKNMITVILVGFSVFNANIVNVIADDKAEANSILGDWYVIGIIAKDLDLSSVPKCWNVTIYPSPLGSLSSIKGISHFAEGSTGERVAITFKATPILPVKTNNSIDYNIAALKFHDGDFTNYEQMDFQTLHYVIENGLARWHIDGHETDMGLYSFDLIASRHPELLNAELASHVTQIDNNESNTCSLFYSPPSTVKPIAAN